MERCAFSDRLPGFDPWPAVLVLGTTAASYALACVTPFAAIATAAAAFAGRREASALSAATWLANQLVGYLFLGYPPTADSFAWGAVIGLAALCATFTAGFVLQSAPRRLGLGLAAALLAAFATDEVVLFGASWFLPASPEAFALSVLVPLFATNLVALILLVAARSLVDQSRARRAARRSLLPAGAAR